MLNAVAGSLGLAIQLTVFIAVYLGCAPRRGRSIAALFGAIAATNGYALMLLGAMTAGIPWQTANIVFAAIMSAFLLMPSFRVHASRRLSSAVLLLKQHWSAAALVVLVVGFHVLIAALVPEVSIDGQLYHGPALAQLVQTGTIWGWSTPNQYLDYTDLAMVGSINLATFTGRTWFDNAAQVPHLLLLILVVNAALVRRFDRAWVRVAVALLIVSAPVIWIQPRILYVDVAYGAAVAALIVLIATHRRSDALDVLFAAIAGAAILAIKPTGITTSTLLLSVLLVAAVVRRRRAGRQWGRAVGPVLGVIAAPSILALGFYLRNLVQFGNPVYPVAAAIGPLRLPGIVDLSVFASGDRGSGLIDPLRWITYAGGILDGVVHGVVKPDYDPRSGGFGWMPLLVTAVVLLATAIQVVVVLRHRGGERDRRFSSFGNWRVQLVLAVLAAVVLLVQPSTFDSRYVIGPTVVLVIVVALSAVARPSARVAEICAGLVALVLAIGQAGWVEFNVYPGSSDIKKMRTLPQEWQPVTPGNPWGRGESVAWLPDDPTTCDRIVLQTEGGVGATGMKERSALSTLPYGLYGASLCNLVSPVQLMPAEGQSSTRDPLLTADFLVVYTKDVGRWGELAPDVAACWRPIQTIEPTETYPESITVLRARCD